MRAGAEGIPAGRALVVGLARSGLAAADALERRGIEVVRVDRSLGNDDDVSLLDGVAFVVKSPGVPREHPLVVAARVPVWGEVELAARLLPARLVGVTGTNGKTTTSELLGAVFRSAARPVEVAGNVGRPLTSLVGTVSPDAWVVCELSSFPSSRSAPTTRTPRRSRAARAACPERARPSTSALAGNVTAGGPGGTRRRSGSTARTRRRTGSRSRSRSAP